MVSNGCGGFGVDVDGSGWFGVVRGCFAVFFDRLGRFGCDVWWFWASATVWLWCLVIRGGFGRRLMHRRVCWVEVALETPGLEKVEKNKTYIYITPPTG